MLYSLFKFNHLIHHLVQFKNTPEKEFAVIFIDNLFLGRKFQSIYSTLALWFYEGKETLLIKVILEQIYSIWSDKGWIIIMVDGFKSNLLKLLCYENLRCVEQSCYSKQCFQIELFLLNIYDQKWVRYTSF